MTADVDVVAPLPWTVLVTQIPDQGLAVERDATESERAGLAAALDIEACARLRVALRVRALSRGRYRVTGAMTAAVTQRSIVSLDPVDATLAEEIDVEYWPEDQIAAPTEEERDVLGGEDPEPIVSGRIDIGRLVFEVFAASLDPYPRRPDEDLGENGLTAAPRDAGPSGPFAALARLRDTKE